MEEDQMAPSRSYLPPNQTQGLLADFTLSTHMYLHRALCSWPRLPNSQPPDLMSCILASIIWRWLLSHRRT